jgi:hypothetical protein
MFLGIFFGNKMLPEEIVKILVKERPVHIEEDVTDIF